MLVGLGYKPRRGKDTVADFLHDEYGFRKISISKDLIVPEYLAQHGELPTKQQQIEFGMLRRRQEGLAYWLNQMAELILAAGPNVVWPNVRFPNEVHWIKSQGGFVWHITRDEQLPRDAADTTEQEGGRTEQCATEIALDGWTDWDCTITNDGSKEDLWPKIDAALAQCSKK